MNGELLRQPKLTKAEERRFFATYAKGQAEGATQRQIELAAKAREHIINALLPHVYYLANEYTNNGVELDDLVQAGCVGLLKAFERFDYESGYRLKTYAEADIRSQMVRCIRESKPVRVPTDPHHALVRLKRESAALEEALGHEPSSRELASALGATEAEIAKTLRCDFSTISVDHAIDDEGTCLADVLPSISAQRAYEESEGQNAYLEWISCLNEEDQELLVLRFGLEAHRRHSLSELAKRRGESVYSVKKALNRVIHCLTHPSMRDYFA